MSRARALLTVYLVLLMAMLALSGALGSEEFREFPEFRYTSALPGGGWGVTSTGEPGFDGALQINVPVAYTPYEGIIVGYSSASYDTTPELSFSGGGANGTATVAVGLGRPGHGIYVCEMGTSSQWEPAENVQVQLAPECDRKPALAVGVQDIFGHRDRVLGQDFQHDTESPYVVATQQMAFAERPTYVTVGWGWGRFNSRPFGGVSYRAAANLTVMAEYDGFNVNAGAAYDLSSAIADHTTVFAGLIDLDRTVIGLTYVYR